MKQAGKENGIVVTFKDSILNVDRKKFLSVLFTESDRYSVNIFKPNYSEQKLTEYIYLTYGVDEYFSNFSLLNGKFPNEESSEEFRLSTHQDKKNTGRLFSYLAENEFNIKSLKQLPADKSITGSYIFVIKDLEKIDPFINSLEKKLETIIKYSKYEKQTPIQAFWLQIIPIFLLYILAFLMTVYYYFSQYKNFAVQILHGYSVMHIWKKYFGQILFFYFTAMFLATFTISAIQVGSLLFTFEWLKVLITYFLYHIIIGTVFCIITSLIFIRTKDINISNSLKNEKPLKQIQFLNSFIKILFSAIMLYLIFLSYSVFSMAYNYYSANVKEWEKMKSYGVMYASGPTPNGNQPKAVLELFDKHYELFKYTNNKGAILIDISDAYEAKEAGINIPNQSKFAVDIIRINNNYLKVNPIISVDNEAVTVDESEEELVILVPEKYKSEEEALKVFLEEEYQFQKYGAKNSFLQDIGEDIEPSDDKLFRIVWVKNGQSYFTFSNRYVRDTNNHFYDGIGVVLTNNNGNKGALYDTVVGNDSYFIKLTDKKNPYNSVKEEIVKLGLQDLYSEVYNAYDFSNYEMQEEIKRMYVYIFILIITLLIYFIVSFFTM